MRTGVVAAGVLLMILAFGSFVIFPAVGEEAAGGAGGIYGFSIAVLISGIMGFLGFVLLIAGLAASPPQEKSTPTSDQTPNVSISGGSGWIDELEKLNKLKEKGAITEEEFKRIKGEIMNEKQAPKSGNSNSEPSKGYYAKLALIVIAFLFFFIVFFGTY